LLSGSAAPQLAQDVPGARQRLDGYLRAANSGSRTQIREFFASGFAPNGGNPPPADLIAEREWQSADVGGGYELKRVEEEAKTSVVALLRQRKTGFWSRMRVYVEPDRPYRMVGFGSETIAAPADLLPSHKLSRTEIHRNLNSLVAHLTSKGQFSGAVMLSRPGERPFLRAFGLANRAWRAPNRVDTRFNIASLGKMFTAVAVAQLAESGRLNYSDKVGKLLPDYPNAEAAAKITVHQLLTHTSGLMSARESVSQSLLRVNEESRRLGEVPNTMAGLLKEPLRSEPGRSFSYSNLGYLVLGAVVERVSGLKYEDYLARSVFAPAGMVSTGLFGLDEERPNVATGYLTDSPNPTFSNVYHVDKGTAAGGAFSTVEDLDRFITAMRTRRILKDASVKRIWSEQSIDPAAASSYGYGFVLDNYARTPIVGHSGGWFGVNANLEHFPSLGHSFVILANQDAPTTAVAHKVREWLTQGTRLK